MEIKCHDRFAAAKLAATYVTTPDMEASAEGSIFYKLVLSPVVHNPENQVFAIEVSDWSIVDWYDKLGKERVAKCRKRMREVRRQIAKHNAQTAID